MANTQTGRTQTERKVQPETNAEEKPAVQTEVKTSGARLGQSGSFAKTGTSEKKSDQKAEPPEKMKMPWEAFLSEADTKPDADKKDSENPAEDSKK
jgi:hypothetical protein